MPLTHFQKLYSHRELLYAWTWRTIRGRYQQSALGSLWALGQPVAQVAIFTFVFTQVVPVDTDGPPYLVFSYTAMVPWLFFSSAVADMVISLTSNMNLVTKIYFPREILPIAALLARFLDFLIASSLLVVLIIYYKVPIFPLGWLYLPLIILVQTCLALGLGFFGAAMNVFYRDINQIIGLVIRLWFYASPIIYPVSRVPTRFQTLYFLNPMAGILESYRDVILHESVPGPYLWLAAGISIVVLLIGYWFFKRVEFQFADVV